MLLTNKRNIVLRTSNLHPSQNPGGWLYRFLLVASLLLGTQAKFAIAQTPPSTTTRLSQATSTIPFSQQGTQLLLNGRSFNAAWSQWQAGGTLRTGISDAGLVQAIGAELLNTEDVQRQPVQWFSDTRTTPLNLPTRLTGAVRYLDITDFAKFAGWQLQVTGGKLQINPVATKILAVRQGKQPWGDRIVIELDRPTTWQVDQVSQEFTLTIDAQVDNALLNPNLPPSASPIQTSPGSQLAFLLSRTAPNQTQLRLGIPLSLRPRVWSLANPNRLIVDVRPDSMVDRNILWAPGLRWRSQIVNLGSDRFSVIWLAINPRQSGLNVRPILPNSTMMMGIAPLLQTARQAQVSAAINGGFFNRNNQLPLGAVRRDLRWLSGPILNRGAIAWNDNGEFKMDRLSLQETVITQTGQRLPLTHLNSGYVQAGIARYTPDWGTVYTSLSDSEIAVAVQNNRIASQQPVPKVGGSVPIPANGYLLVLRSNQTAATSLPVGTTLRLESVTNPPDFNRYPHIVAAGPLLLQNGQVVLNAEAEKFSKAFVNERASRSAIAQTADGTIMIVAVHNRLDGKGVSLPEIAQLVRQLGAVNALNLDGGSSTTLYLGGQILDRPSRTSARVHNGIGIFAPFSP